MNLYCTYGNHTHYHSQSQALKLPMLNIILTLGPLHEFTVISSYVCITHTITTTKVGVVIKMGMTPHIFCAHKYCWIMEVVTYTLDSTLNKLKFCNKR